ncbi:MAG: hypothetical protein J6U64_02850, partial [Alphaproteobacteria bacterium]|nr:hypothetical protein [Alphaproteobacteria bacterium]
MKKTTVLLLTCALPVMLSACYSTMDEERARVQKRRAYQSVMGCQTDDVYAHAGYRECVENTAQEKARRKKTVYLSETIEGQAMVVSKGDGDIEMLDPTAVYERVEYKVPNPDGEENVEEGSVVVTDESLVYMEGQEASEKSEAETITTTTTIKEEPLAEREASPDMPPSKSAEEMFREKFFDGETEPSKYEETTEKIKEDNPLAEKE